MTKLFGPDYTKINTIFKRDSKNVIIPGEYATDEISYLAFCDWYWHEKIDGMNMRLHWNGERVLIGGREDDAMLPSRLVAKLAPFLDPENWLKVARGSDDFTVYGEGYGQGIHGGGKYSDQMQFIVFDVRVGDTLPENKVDHWWLEREAMNQVASDLGFDVAPFVGKLTVAEAWAELTEVGIKSAWDKSNPTPPPGANGNACEIEGLVGRPAVELTSRKGERILAKMKIKDWTDYRDKNEKMIKGPDRG